MLADASGTSHWSDPQPTRRNNGLGSLQSLLDHRRAAPTPAPTEARSLHEVAASRPPAANERDIPTRLLRDPNTVTQVRNRTAPDEGTQVRSREYLDQMKEHMRRNGFDFSGDPMMASYRRGDPKIDLPEGTHRAMIADELGLPNVRVRVNGDPAALDEFVRSHSAPTQSPQGAGLNELSFEPGSRLGMANDIAGGVMTAKGLYDMANQLTGGHLPTITTPMDMAYGLYQRAMDHHVGLDRYQPPADARQVGADTYQTGGDHMEYGRMGHSVRGGRTRPSATRVANDNAMFYRSNGNVIA